MDLLPSASSSEPLSSSTPDSWPQAQDSVPPVDSEMEVQPDFIEDTSSVWDLTYLLDFNLDEQIVIPLDADQNSELPEQLELPPPENPSTDKVRKRDPRLACSNFLAGRIPCACPELDQKLEDEGLPRKKRARTVRASDAVVRCQVPECEVDISELKGYHRRHRVCLRCANATKVVLDGEAKRYCQQCGKFHVLADFDEGKRSCRRKLQHHNIIRRRRTKDCRGATKNDLQPVMQPEDVEYDGEAGKDSSYLSSQITERGASLEHDSAPDTQNVNSDGIVSYVVSGETQQVNGRIDNPIFSRSSSYHDKSPYVPMCPTGRISFKLYDWNPAEFPRRLRHQIFEWLASMPVELEEYIRPGCTILTAFIAMPKLMWMNLNEDPICYVHDIVAPGKMLSGRGTMVVHLNEMIFRVFEDGVSTMEVELKVQTPRLHYVHPTYFEAGKPMEFVACGSNLMQPKFRLLVSFSGKYLKYESCVVSPHSWTEDSISCGFKDQLYKIYIPHTEPNLFGPAFIEVENESGLSNFIPVLVGDKEVCSEMKTLQQRLDATLISKQFQSASVGYICGSCEAYMLRHAAYSDFLVDIGWLLKDPTSEKFHGALTASQIQRLHYLLNFLICDDSTTILGKILQNLMILTETKELKNVNNQMSDADMTLLQECMYYARHALYQKNQNGREFVMHSVAVHSEINRYGFAQSYCQDNIPSAAPMCQGSKVGENAKLGVLRGSSYNVRSERIPLSTKDTIMNVDTIQEMPGKSGRRYLTRGFLSSRPAILVIASVAVCIGICSALLHTDRVGEFAVSIRRCLFKSN